ncbi:hypothetical protein FQR65_LT17286 [Abscondita terminalis]|nr:hypothetical protein FQR65_LT17286 [Abscondita terminalis]
MGSEVMGHVYQGWEIVVIDFFDGNIDRPFVVGRIHEAQRPSKFDDKGKLPDTKKLAGIKSKEYQDQQSVTQQSWSTQLNLGNLSHPKETDSSEGRGEGFELRTDQWGAVRAGQGLLLSTHAQDGASGNHLDTTEAKSQLESSLNNAKALSEVAKNQQTDPLEVLNELKQFLNQIEKGEKDKADAFKQALMVLASPNSIGLSSNEDIHVSADKQISHSAGDSINLSTQKNFLVHAQNKISLFAAQEGARLYAAKGKVEIQAQGDGADLIARKGIQIISTEDVIEVKSLKEIILTSGTSQLKINGSGVFVTTGGMFEVKAGQHSFIGGAKVDYSLPTFYENIYCTPEKFNSPYYKIPYEKLKDLEFLNYENFGTVLLSKDVLSSEILKGYSFKDKDNSNYIDLENQAMLTINPNPSTGKGNYKIYLGLVLAFTVGCDGKVITNNSKDIDLINKFCLNKEPNVNLDINKYLPSESSMENPIKKNLGISVVNFFDKIQNGKTLDNMNIYENQGYIDIIDDNYDSIGRIIIIPDGEYVKYINLEVRSAPDIFKKEILKKTIVDVINVLNNHGDSEIAYNKMLGDLLVLDKLPVEVGFADGTVGNNVEDNKNYMSNLDANINIKTGYIFFKSTNYVPYDNEIENNIAKMLA